ncbi:hypothetical protein [Campylobacter corcagiensis]|uniref:Uncharacterized protein n=1 Tax=Campylobacter corcagiensis TaxID=1448857 RepID=A0A7M1LGQ4_9BACT|nr:hypothetical protein [Campylobacter corcagiensis]QKF64063.1 hypothetical protein CCORG_0174 [Campylobacter corcagiensis]QOQ87738.1 hypothetical protein IMC76_02700 [Campylobacter corcagiensis]
MKFIIIKLDKEKYSQVIQKLDELKTNDNYKRNFDCYFIEEKVTYSDDFADKFVVFNDEYYAINDDKNSDEYFYNKFYFLKSESEFNDLVKIYKITNLYKRDRGGYMVGFNNNTFICFSQMSTDSGLNSPNVFKILFLQILSISYQGLNQEFLQNLQNLDGKFDDVVASDLTFKIHNFRLKEIKCNLYKSHIGDETYEIYKMIVEYFDFKNTFEKISQVFQEIFAVKTREYEIKNIKLQNDFNEHIKNLFEEQKKQTLEREKQDKKMNKFVKLGTSITILTFISVIADIFNLWDRFKVNF